MLQIADHSQRKLQEMNAVHERFKEIVQKKDARHSTTLTHLTALQLQCSKYEEVLQQQQAHLQRLAGS